MRKAPEQKLDPRVKMVWRITDAFWVLVASACLLGSTLPLIGIEGFDGFARTVLTVEVIVVIAAFVLVLVVLPPIRYVRWRYEVSQDYLDIAKGIIWRKRYVIPFIRVQNTDTRQGPIMRTFKLASVTVATAAREHEIPGLDFQVAEQLRDRAAELARIAREDV